MIFRNGWGKFNLDCYFDNLKQPNGEYRIGLRVCCDETDKTSDLLAFAKSIVGDKYAEYVKCIRFIDNNYALYGEYEKYALEAVVDMIFKDRDEAYRVVWILGSMSCWPDKTFEEVGVILENMLDKHNDIGLRNILITAATMPRVNFELEEA